MPLYRFHVHFDVVQVLKLDKQKQSQEPAILYDVYLSFHKDDIPVVQEVRFNVANILGNMIVFYISLFLNDYITLNSILELF